MPGVGRDDPRGRVAPAELPWSALVLVQIPGISRCTGFLVAPRLVVTAAHCLYGARVRHLLQPASIHVLSGYVSGDYGEHSLVAAYRLGAGFSPGDGGQSRGADVAVLTLMQPVARVELRLVSAIPGQAAMLGGYNQDRAQVLEADRNCRIMGVVGDAASRPLRQHSCAGTRGTSGAPLLVRDGAQWAAAGVQVAAEVGDVGGLAVPAESIRALLP